MNKNDEIKIEIRDLHSNGSGVGAHESGKIVFVPEALPGDILRAKVLKVKKNYAYGKIIEIIKPSLKRTKPECSVAGRCGGCQFQHLKYSDQLEFKEKLVIDALTRIGGCESVPILPILGMDEPYRYRNKAQFPVGNKGMGFYAARSHRIVPISGCNIHLCDEAFQAVQRALKKNPILAYDEENHRGLLRHVVIRSGLNTGEVMIIFVLNTKLSKARELLAGIDLPYNIVVNENTARTNVILGPKFAVLKGDGCIHEVIGHIRYRISPGAFFQVNSAQTRVLYDTVASLMKKSQSLRVIDAYSGIGGIALYIADLVQEVVGIESVPEAVEDGIYNAKINNIENARFLCGAVEILLPKLLDEKSCEGYDTLILDPPRKGAESALIEAAVAAKVPNIVYVSCDPATLARDVKLFMQDGYQLVSVQPVDMFPMTGHVETVVLLQRRDT